MRLGLVDESIHPGTNAPIADGANSFTATERPSSESRRGVDLAHSAFTQALGEDVAADLLPDASRVSVSTFWSARASRSPRPSP